MEANESPLSSHANDPLIDGDIASSLRHKLKFNRLRHRVLSVTGPRNQLIANEMEHDRLTSALAYYERDERGEGPSPTDELLDAVVDTEREPLFNRDEVHTLRDGSSGE